MPETIADDKETTPLNGMRSTNNDYYDRKTTARRNLWCFLAAAVASVMTLLLFAMHHRNANASATTDLPFLKSSLSNDWLPDAIVANYSLPITILGDNDDTPTSSSSSNHKREIQYLFDLGLMECFGFAFDEAQTTAQRMLASLKDDHSELSACACPMCYWLEAMAHSPYINHPRLASQPKKFEQAQAAARKAYQCLVSLDEEEQQQQISEKERGLIHAMYWRYNNNTSVENEVQGYQHYRSALQEMLTTKSVMQSQDKDILAFLADAIMILHCDDGYNFYDDQNQPKPDIVYAMQLLETCLEIGNNASATTTDNVARIVTHNSDHHNSSSSPKHPLCQHLYIHITEPSLGQAGKAQGAADGLVLAAAQTQAQHLQHMPSHTFLRVGRYHDAALANIQAHQSDAAWMEEQDDDSPLEPQHWPYGPAHDLGFLIHTATLSGERSMAYDYANVLRAHYRKYPDMPDYPNAELGFHLWRTTRLRFGDAEDILLLDDDDEPPRPWPYTQVLGHYTKGVALLAEAATKGSTTPQSSSVPAPVQKELEALQKILPNVSDSFHGVALVANASLSSSIQYWQGNHEAALQFIQVARLEQESWAYTEPPAWHMTVLDCEATLLLNLGRAQEAVQIFQRAVETVPENRFSLYGLWRATQETEDYDDDALEVLRKRWQDASHWADDKSEIELVPHVCPLYYQQDIP